MRTTPNRNEMTISVLSHVLRPHKADIKSIDGNIENLIKSQSQFKYDCNRPRTSFGLLLLLTLAF